MAITRLNNNSISSISALPSGVGGKVLQVVNQFYDTQTSTTGTSFVDTGLNFVHVNDVARGHFLALEKGEIGDRYILGGENMSLKSLLDQVAKFGNVPKVKLKLPTKSHLWVAVLLTYLNLK